MQFIKLINEISGIKRDGNFFVIPKRKMLEKLKFVPNDSHIMVGGIHIHVLFTGSHATASRTSNAKNHRMIPVERRPHYIVDFLLNVKKE